MSRIRIHLFAFSLTFGMAASVSKRWRRMIGSVGTSASDRRLRLQDKKIAELDFEESMLFEGGQLSGRVHVFEGGNLSGKVQLLLKGEKSF